MGRSRFSNGRCRSSENGAHGLTHRRRRRARNRINEQPAKGEPSMSPPTERPDHTSNARPPKRCNVSVWARNGRDWSTRHRARRSDDDYARTWKRSDEDARNAEETDSTTTLHKIPPRRYFSGLAAVGSACWLSPSSLRPQHPIVQIVTVSSCTTRVERTHEKPPLPAQIKFKAPKLKIAVFTPRSRAGLIASEHGAP